MAQSPSDVFDKYEKQFLCLFLIHHKKRIRLAGKWEIPEKTPEKPPEKIIVRFYDSREKS